jgi:hypothetical protein
MTREKSMKMIPRIRGKKPGASKKVLYTFIFRDAKIK